MQERTELNNVQLRTSAHNEHSASHSIRAQSNSRRTLVALRDSGGRILLIKRRRVAHETPFSCGLPDTAYDWPPTRPFPAQLKSVVAGLLESVSCGSAVMAPIQDSPSTTVWLGRRRSGDAPRLAVRTLTPAQLDDFVARAQRVQHAVRSGSGGARIGGHGGALGGAGTLANPLYATLSIVSFDSIVHPPQKREGRADDHARSAPGDRGRSLRHIEPQTVMACRTLLALGAARDDTHKATSTSRREKHSDDGEHDEEVT